MSHAKACQARREIKMATCTFMCRLIFQGSRHTRKPSSKTCYYWRNVVLTTCKHVNVDSMTVGNVGKSYVNSLT